jgi:hypothetical protein
VAGLLAVAGPASADSTKYTMFSPDGITSSEVFELNTFGGNNTLTGNDGTRSGVQSRDPARTVTMLDDEGTPVVTYSLKDSPRGDDRVGATGLKSDSNEVAIESVTAKTLPSVDGRASVSGEPVSSLGRENSIEM